MNSPQAKVVDETAPTTPSLKESPQRWWLMVLLVIGMILCYAHRGAINVAAPFMKEFHLSLADKGNLFSAFFLLYCFMQMPAGWLVDRFGVRRAYALGFAFWSLAVAATGFANSFLMLFSLRMLLGVGQAVAFPASARAVANWFRDRERGTVTGGYLAGVRWGQALVNGVGGLFLAAYDWRLFFLVIGLSSLLWLLPWWGFLGRWEKGPASAAAADRKQPSSSSLPFFQSLALLRHRSVFGIFLGFFAYDYAWFVYQNWLPEYLIGERQFSPKEMLVYSSAPFAVMSVIILLSGFLSDWLIRRGRSETRVRKIFIVVGMALACLIVPAGLVADKMTAVWLMTISLCGLGISAPNTWTLTQAACSKHIVGTVSGIQNFGGNLGGIIAPALTGYIAHKTNSFALALSITGAVLVVGILAYAFLISQKVVVTTPVSEASARA